ncbi:hypothetical protein [Reichenbachiella sp.]|uniref:hypothetical protein n=1 Tax=Reichenbachiella sp. TaxID=2184521 RepID=UPI003B599BE9
MQISGKAKYGLMLLFCFSFVANRSPAQKLWSQVRHNRATTYVNQPVEVTITVYTSTWFTSGLDPGNIKVNGAFTTYFRPVSTSYMDGNQNYAGIQLIYNVFPFDEKDVVFPSLTLEVESPPEGDYKGVKRKLKTKERIIKVSPIPPGFNKSDWLVANGLTVHDQWNQSKLEVKVGSVLERSITRRAEGTVAELIPPINWDSVTHVGLYPTRSVVENYKGKTSISSSRTESMRYLFEKEGKVTFPEMIFTWYHPTRKKLYKKTLKAVTYTVIPNPDLEMLASVRDSLLVEKKLEEGLANDEEVFAFLGMSWKQLVKIGVFTVFLFSILIFLIKRIVHSLQARRKAYIHSEDYYFDQLKNALEQKDRSQIVKAAYRWFDELEFENGGFLDWASIFGSTSFKNQIQDLEEEKLDIEFHLNDWKSARKRYFGSLKNVVHRGSLNWINP